jgi:hypothetical protein
MVLLLSLVIRVTTAVVLLVLRSVLLIPALVLVAALVGVGALPLALAVVLPLRASLVLLLV